MIHLGLWDVVLLIAVSSLGTAMAYVYDPRWKALLLSLPVPFTLASLSLGRPVDITNVSALSLLLIFTHAVRILHVRLRLPIVAVIAIPAVGYCLLGATLAKVLPVGDTAFWVSVAVTLALGAVLYLTTPHEEEPGHRTSLPVWMKWPAIAAVIILLVSIKHHLLGFMTMFPILGVIGAYEGRYSLRTNCRMIPVMMLSLTPMLVTCRLAHLRFGLGASLALAWVVYCLLMAPLVRNIWCRDAEASRAGEIRLASSKELVTD